MTRDPPNGVTLSDDLAGIVDLTTVVVLGVDLLSSHWRDLSDEDFGRVLATIDGAASTLRSTVIDWLEAARTFA